MAMEVNSMAISEAGREDLFGRVATNEMGLTVDETAGGLALIALGILALAGMYAGLLTSIAAVVAGVALVFMSVALNREFTEVLATSGREMVSSEAGGGLGAGAAAGITGIVLGILAILDIARPTLVAVSLIVFGAAVFINFIMSTQTRALRMTASSVPAEPAKLTMTAAAETELTAVLVGVALVVLGIIALTGARSEVLIACAFLSFGGYLFLKATATVGHMFWWNRTGSRSETMPYRGQP
jgi:hypothetical protein